MLPKWKCGRRATVLQPGNGPKLRRRRARTQWRATQLVLRAAPHCATNVQSDQPADAIAIRLRDPELLREASERLQRIPGAQVVTLTEMMGTFLNLVGAVRTLLFSIALVAMTVSVLGVFNTLLAAVVERTNELSVMRAIGASRSQIIALITTEALLLTGAGSLAGIVSRSSPGAVLKT